MELNKSNVKKILSIILFTVLLLLGLEHLGNLLNVFGSLLGLLSPFILGASMAFIMNVPMRFLERKLFSHKNRQHVVQNRILIRGNANTVHAGKDSSHTNNSVSSKRRNRSGEQNKQDKKQETNTQAEIKKEKIWYRPISIIMTLLIIFGILFIVLFLMLPEIGRTFGILKDGFPDFIKQVEEWMNQLIIKFPQIEQWISEMEFDISKIDIEQIGKNAMSFFKGGVGLLTTTAGVVSSVVSGIANFVIGFVFAIYILVSKEKLARQIKQILFSVFPEDKAERTINIFRLSDKIFSNFLAGQCTEAVILGFMFFVTMGILQFPYALLVGVLVAFTALIPIFGAFIGCFIGFFLILMVNPVQAVWFFVLFLVLQQLEGNLIYPHVVGNSVGLPSIWVLVAVTLGGSLMGILGMLIFIPICSVLYALTRENVYKTLGNKKISEQKWNKIDQ